MFLRSLGFILAFSPNVLFASQLSSEARISSDYISRGITKTDHSPTVAGCFFYDFDFGLKVGTSVTNVGADDARGVQLKPNINYSYALHQLFTLHAGVSYYYNPFAILADTADFHIGAWIGNYFHFTTFYSKRFFARNSSATYLVAETDLPVPHLDTLFVGLSGGYSIFSNEVNAGNKNYLDYRITLHQRVNSSDIGIAVTGTNRRIVDMKGLDKSAKDESFHAYYSIKI